ncbi:MAG: hypothetical protein J3Q66DRAFT_408403 [Benniella sp.]|nr:MAG: hypothetical protein J3Q66DRAFT_408403 [Benniella sp.]
MKPSIALALAWRLTLSTHLVNAQLSLGCYASGLTTDLVHDGTTIHSGVPILPGLSSPYRDIYVSQGACTAHCKLGQYSYAITAGGTTCYCANQELPESNRVQDHQCDKSCVGYPLETCGSAFLGTGSVRVNEGSGVFANVMLVSNSLSVPHTSSSSSPAPPLPLPPRPSPSPSSISTSSLILDSVVTTTATAVARGTIGPRPEIRNDAEGVKTSSENDSDEAAGEEKEGNDDPDYADEEGEDEEDEDEDQNEDEEGDRDEGNGNSETGESGESGESGTKSSSFGVPVASTAVAVVCAIGVCAFIVYATKKRKLDRARATRVNSVFGVASRGSGSDPYKAKDNRSARDNRDLYSPWTRRGSITIPSTAAGRNPRGALGRSYSHQTTVGVGYPNRPPSQSTICNDPVFYPDQYEEYYAQEGDQVVSEEYPNDLSSKVVSPARVLAPRPITQSYNGEVTQARPSNYSNPISVHPLQLPYRPIHTSNHPACSTEQRHDYDDPFQDPAVVPQHPHHHPSHLGPVRHHKTQRHSIHTFPSGHRSLWHRPGASDYRRPQSLVVSSGGCLHDEEGEAPIRYRTHVLDENDSKSTDSEVALSGSRLPRRGIPSAITGKLSGSLRQQFKRLSTPYVQAIRQQQQQHQLQHQRQQRQHHHQQQKQPSPNHQQKQYHPRVNVLSCIEEGYGGMMDGGGNESDPSMPVPGPSPRTEERWSRVLLKSVVGNIPPSPHGQ